MKTVALTNVAWVGTIRTVVDGDDDAEAVWDLHSGDIAGRLGYLKAKADASFQLPSNNAVLGDNTHAGTETFNGQATFNYTSSFNDDLSANASLTVSGSLYSVGSASFQGATSFIGPSSFTAPVRLATELLNTSLDSVIGVNTVWARVGVTPANRIYTLPAASGDGQMVRLCRPGTTAFTVTLATPAAVTVGVIPASQAGWIVAVYSGGAWKAQEWSSNITSILATV